MAAVILPFRVPLTLSLCATLKAALAPTLPAHLTIFIGAPPARTSLADVASLLSSLYSLLCDSMPSVTVLIIPYKAGAQPLLLHRALTLLVLTAPLPPLDALRLRTLLAPSAKPEMRTMVLPELQAVSDGDVLCGLDKQVKACEGEEHECVALGGTFDHLHAGHRVLLAVAALTAKSLVVLGVTGAPMLTKKAHASLLEPLHVRYSAALRVLHAVDSRVKCEVHELSEPMGPSANDARITALVASQETAPNLPSINSTRATHCLAPLQFHIVPLVTPPNTLGDKLSSTAVRAAIAARAQISTTTSTATVGDHAAVTQMRYNARGVSAQKEDVHAAVKQLDAGLVPGAFAKLMPDYLTGSADHCIAMHADGAGTKSVLAYLYWRETGDVSVWEGIAQDALVMNIDDLLCVGACTGFMVSSSIARNKRLVPGTVITALIHGTESVAQALRAQGVDVHLTGGETADVGDVVRTVLVDSVVVARMPRASVISNARIAPGDVIVALASEGQCAYERAFNSGVGANGLTAARHDLFHAHYAAHYPECFEPSMEPTLAYTGAYLLTDRLPALSGLTEPSSLDVGRLALSPTRSYAPIFRRVFASLPSGAIHGSVHCTGGGQTKVLHSAPPGVHIVKDSLFPVPMLMRNIQSASGTTWREMYQVFNMGHRMELYVPPEHAPAIIAAANEFGVAAKVVGRVLPADTGVKCLTIRSEHGEFVY